MCLWHIPPLLAMVSPTHHFLHDNVVKNMFYNPSSCNILFLPVNFFHLDSQNLVDALLPFSIALCHPTGQATKCHVHRKCHIHAVSHPHKVSQPHKVSCPQKMSQPHKLSYAQTVTNPSKAAYPRKVVYQSKLSHPQKVSYPQTERIHTR